MPTSFRRTRALAGGLALALSGSLVVACSGEEIPAPSERASVGAPDPTSATPTPKVQPNVAQAIARALRQRTDAVRQGNESAFTGGLAEGDAGFGAEQRTYFANLTQLPLERFEYAADPRSMVRTGRHHWVTVTLTMQLAGYDDRPVITADRFLFTPARGKAGRGAKARYVLASTSDPAWEAEHQVRPQPWDEGPVQIRNGRGVLGVFDSRSVAYAGGILASVERGLTSVSAAVPYPWSRSVVVYALSDSRFLRSVEGLPGDDPERIDGAAFPVYSSSGGSVASTRFVLHPRMLSQGGPERDRLIRHELTHVAVGVHDDLAPVWLSEGLAEWVSVLPLAPQNQQISRVAIKAARAGFDRMPPDDSFNDGAATEHYALAWWAIEYFARSAGERAPWSLLDAFSIPGANEQQVLRNGFGLGSKGLARKAGRLIIATFDPDPEPEPSESPSPSDEPSASPTSSTSP